MSVSTGTILSGRLVDRFAKSHPQIDGTVPAIALALAVPPFIGFVAAPTWQIASLCLAGPAFLNAFYLPPAVALVQSSVAPQQRTLAGAVLLLM